MEILRRKEEEKKKRGKFTLQQNWATMTYSYSQIERGEGKNVINEKMLVFAEKNGDF